MYCLYCFKRCLYIILMAAAICFGADNSDDASRPDCISLLKEKLNGDKPLTWVFTGDSITHGARHTNGWRSYPELFAERVRWELGRKADVIINTGVSGNKTSSILNDFDSRVMRFEPDIVSIMIGTNDCAAKEEGYELFAHNLREMIDALYAADVLVILHTPNPILPEGYNGTRIDLDNYVEIIRKAAAEKKTVLIDNYAYWRQQKTGNDALMVWLSDSIHPNEYGHRAIAMLLYKELGIFSPDSRACTLFIP